MTAIRQSARRTSQPEARPSGDIGGGMVLMGLRVVLMGCAFALVGVVGQVAWKVINV